MEDLIQFQETTDQFVMPKREEIQIFGGDGPKESRQIGEPIKQKIGLAVLDTRRINLLKEPYYEEKNTSVER